MSTPAKSTATKSTAAKKKTAATRSRKAKSEAWEEFARYVKERDCLRTTHMPEVGECISCGKVIPIRFGDRWYGGAHAGHFVPGRGNAILFHPRLVHLQCAACNIYRRGNWPGYYEALVRRWGEKEVTRLVGLRRQVVKNLDFEEVKEKYARRRRRLERIWWNGERWKRK